MDLSTREGRRQQGSRIRAAAQAAGLSLDDLAGRIDCSRALIYQYTSGVSLAQSDRLQQIAAVVGKPLAWFFLDDPDGAEESQLLETTDLTRQRAALREDQRRLANDRRQFRDQRARAQIESLYTLLHASMAPPDWRRVADVCQQLTPLLQQRDDVAGTAEVLFQQGNALIQLNEWGPAKDTLEKAGSLFRELNQPARSLACLQSLGHVNVMLGRVEEGLIQFEQVAAGEDWWNRWQGALSMGATYEMLGDYATSATCLETTLRTIEERQDTSDAEVARLYLEANWANLELDNGDYQGALRRSDLCLDIAQRQGTSDQYLEALLNQGVAILEQGDTAAASRCIRQALSLAQLTRDHSRWSLALACQSLCEIRQQRHIEALDSGKEALAIALRCGASRAEILAQRALAEAYLAANSPREANYHIEQGLALALHSRGRLAEAQFRALKAEADLAAGRREDASISLRSAQQLAESLGARPVQLQCREIAARVALASGDAQEALAQATEALALSRSLSSPLPWRIQSLIAQAFAALGRQEEARAVFESALQDLQNSSPGSAAGAVRDRPRSEESTLASPDAHPLEDRHAIHLWQQWLTFVVATAGPEEALAQASLSLWPPLQEWIASFLTITASSTNKSSTDPGPSRPRSPGKRRNSVDSAESAAGSSAETSQAGSPSPGSSSPGGARPGTSRTSSPRTRRPRNPRGSRGT